MSRSLDDSTSGVALPGTVNVYIEGTYQRPAVTYTRLKSAAGGEPECLLCGADKYLTRIPYGSLHDGEYLCGTCIDRLLRKE